MIAHYVKVGVVATVGMLAAAAVVTLPAMAVLVWVVLGVVVGALVWTWTSATAPAEGCAPDIALRGGAYAIVGGLALAGMTVLLGSATVVVIPTAYAAVGAFLIWRRARRCRVVGRH